MMSNRPYALCYGIPEAEVAILFKEMSQETIETFPGIYCTYDFPYGTDIGFYIGLYWKKYESLNPNGPRTYEQVAESSEEVTSLDPWGDGKNKERYDQAKINYEAFRLWCLAEGYVVPNPVLYHTWGPTG